MPRTRSTFGDRYIVHPAHDPLFYGKRSGIACMRAIEMMSKATLELVQFFKSIPAVSVPSGLSPYERMMFQISAAGMRNEYELLLNRRESVRHHAFDLVRQAAITDCDNWSGLWDRGEKFDFPPCDSPYTASLLVRMSGYDWNLAA